MSNWNDQITLKSMNLRGFKPGEAVFFVQNTGMNIRPGCSDRTGNFLRSIANWLRRTTDFRGSPALAIEEKRIPKFREYCEKRGFQVVRADTARSPE